MNWQTGATLGAAILGLGILAYNLIVWWPGHKALRKSPAIALELAPFFFGFCFGTLAVLCAGGVLGWTASGVLWGGSWLGDGALVWGVGGYREDISRAAQPFVTNGGRAIILVLTFVFLAVLKRGPRSAGPIKHGAVAGVMLATVKGVAGVMAIPLASSVNLAGAWLSTGVLS